MTYGTTAIFFRTPMNEKTKQDRRRWSQLGAEQMLNKCVEDELQLLVNDCW